MEDEVAVYDGKWDDNTVDYDDPNWYIVSTDEALYYIAYSSKKLGWAVMTYKYAGEQSDYFETYLGHCVMWKSEHDISRIKTMMSFTFINNEWVANIYKFERVDVDTAKYN